MMTAMRALVLCGLLTLCGCTKESVEGDRAVYMYEWWVSVVVLVGGTIGTGVCLLAGKEDWRGWLGAVAIAAFTVGFGPMSWFDRVAVDSKTLETRWGFWAYPTVHQVAFADIKGVDLTKRRTSGRRRRTNYYMVFQKKDGSSEEITISNSLMEAAADRIVEALAQNQIAVVDKTGE